MIKKKIRREKLMRMRKEEVEYGVVGAEIRGRRMQLSRTLASTVKEVCSVPYLCKIEKNCIRPNKVVLSELCKRLELDEKTTKSLLDIKNTLFKTVKAFRENDLASLEALSDEVKVFSNYRSKLIIFIYCIYTKKYEKANLIDKDLVALISGMSKDDLVIYLCFHTVLEFYNQFFKEASMDIEEILNTYELSDDLKVIVSQYRLYTDLKLNSFKMASTYESCKELYVKLCDYELLNNANYVLAFYYLQNRDYLQYQKYYKMIKNPMYKYTLLILVKMIFNRKAVIKHEWLKISRPIAKYIVNYYQNKQVFINDVSKLNDSNFDYDFNPIIMEYLALKNQLDRYNYINGVVSKGIKVSNDGSSVKFFLEQYASLCYHHSKYKAFYEFYTIVKDLI
jgi:hypothetical protein